MTSEKQEIVNKVADSPEPGELYALRGAAFMRVLLNLYGRWWIWVYVAVAMVGGMLAILVDFRMLLLSAFVLLILAPATMMFLYFYYGLKPGCFSNYVLHTIAATDEGVELRLYARNEKNQESDAAHDMDKDDRQDEDEAVKIEATGTFVVKYEWLSRYFIMGNGVVFPYSGEEDGFLWLPASHCSVSDCELSAEESTSGMLGIILQRLRKDKK